jgi:hypothetical protein
MHLYATMNRKMLDFSSKQSGRIDFSNGKLRCRCKERGEGSNTTTPKPQPVATESFFLPLQAVNYEETESPLNEEPAGAAGSAAFQVSDRGLDVGRPPTLFLPCTTILISLCCDRRLLPELWEWNPNYNDNYCRSQPHTALLFREVFVSLSSMRRRTSLLKLLEGTCLVARQ